MLNPVGVARHVTVGASLAAVPVLVAFGLIGGGVHEERFEAKQVVVTPAGDGVRIRETVDDDFGNTDRHGYERIIPHDFGEPTDIEASSPDAPDDLSVVDLGSSTQIRIGDPDTTIDGQHRYVLSYTLPAARLSSGVLALDIIGDLLRPETLTTERFEVVLSGFELTDVTCSAARFGQSGGCTLTREGDVYRAVIEPLEPGEGITVGGTIVSLTTPVEVPIPPLPPRRSPSWPLAAGAAGLGLLAGFGGFRLARRMGRNEVGDGGAADAAYALPGGPTRLVTDEEMDSMVTTEFAPPPGIRPWHGAMLLTEEVDNSTVSAWFSDQIALEYLSLTDSSPQVLSIGPKLAQAEQATRDRLLVLLADGPLELGKHQPKLEAMWGEVAEQQKSIAAATGWWKRFAPGTTPRFPAVLTITVTLAAAAVAASVLYGFLRLWPLALLAGFVVPAVVAGAAYRPLLPQRSATGSALALRTESFRRFLQASEGTHVDWAWQHGLLREYSAWAVSLGAAAAWGRAVDASAVPPTDVLAGTGPLLMYRHMGDWTTARSHPAPSGSGGSGGGFSGGGFSGGGGGGGSSGNW